MLEKDIHLSAENQRAGGVQTVGKTDYCPVFIENLLDHRKPEPCTCSFGCYIGFKGALEDILAETNATVMQMKLYGTHAAFSQNMTCCDDDFRDVAFRCINAVGNQIMQYLPKLRGVRFDERNAILKIKLDGEACFLIELRCAENKIVEVKRR